MRLSRRGTPRRVGGFVRSLTFRLIRELKGKRQEELAEVAGMQKSTIQKLERGKKDPPLSTIERCMRALKVSMTAFEEMLALAEEIRDGEIPDQWVGPVLIEGHQVGRARDFGRTVGKLQRGTFRDYVIRTKADEKIAKDREAARQIGIYLRGRENLVEVVRQDPGCHLWSVAEWLCEESMNRARSLDHSKKRERAAECAEAALVVAELAPCDERFRMRLTGYCWGHIGNIRRAKNAFDASHNAFANCSKLLAAGESGDPYGVLDVGRILGMEASLRREQGRFPEALRLLRDAMPVATREIQPYLQLNYGAVLQQMGDSETAIRVLEEAALRAPRHLLFSARFRVGVSLCHLGRHEEAEALLPAVVRLALDTKNEDYQVRVRWLAGRVAVGRGRPEEALVVFRSVQGHFMKGGNAYDAALVSLDLAKLHLERGEVATVKRLAEDMAPIFVDVGVHHHAQEALRIFYEAAVTEVASVELVVRLVTYLERAQRAHGLRFEMAVQ
jgi:tetratricopeptide (TPR) repeat protein